MSIFANVFLGSNANDGSGTDLRDAFAIINQNFANIAAGNAGNVIVTTGVEAILSGTVRRTGNVQLHVNDVIGAASTGYVNSLVTAGNTYVESVAATFGSTNVAVINSNVTALSTTVDGITANVTTLQSNAATQGGQIAFLSANLGAVNAALSASIAALQSNAAVQQAYINNNANGLTGANVAIAGVTAAWTANAGTQQSQISAINANVTAANAAIVTTSNSVTTANIAMKAYVDAKTATLTSNAAAQQSSLDSLSSTVSGLSTSVAAVNTAMLANVTAANTSAATANTAMKSYVDTQVTTLNANAAAQEGAISSLRGNITAANAAIVTANTAVVSYVHALVDPISANTANILVNYNNLEAAINNIVDLYANAAVQASAIAGANAAIVTANVAMKSYVDAKNTAQTANAASQQGQITTLTTNVAAVNSNVNTLISGTIATMNTSIAALQANVSTGPLTISGTGTFGNVITTNGIFWANGNPYSNGGGADTGNITFDGDTISSSDSVGGITLNASGNGEIHMRNYTGFNSGNPSFWVDIGALDTENTGTLGINFSNGGGYSSTAVMTYDWWDGITTGHTNNSSTKHGTLGIYRGDGLPGDGITKAYITFDTGGAASVAPIAVQANSSVILSDVITRTINTTGNINSSANINAIGNIVASEYLLAPNVSVVNFQSNTAFTNYMTVYGNITTAPAIVVYGNAEITGTLVAGNIVPSSDITYDLGSTDNRWRDLYLSGSTIYLGNTAISTTAGGGIATPIDRPLGSWGVAYPDTGGSGGTYTLDRARTPGSTIYIHGGWQNPNYGGPGVPGPGGTFDFVEGDGNFTVDGSTLVITNSQQYQIMYCWEVYTLSGDSISAIELSGDTVTTSNIGSPSGDLTVTGNVIIDGSLTVSPTSIHMGNVTMSAPDGNLVVNTGITFTMANYQHWSTNVSTISDALNQIAERLSNAGF